MRKKLTAILIALTIAISLLPMPAMAANADDEAQIKAIVSKIITDYAASIDRPNADDDAFSVFFKHGFYGKGKAMHLKESDAMTSALFNACLTKEALTMGITHCILRMQDMQIDCMSTHSEVDWHNYYYNYYQIGYEGETKQFPNYIGAIISSSSIYGEDQYTGPRNENDEVMELLAGALYTDLVLHRTEVTRDRAVYEVQVGFKDRFDFTGDYSSIAEKGYDTSKDSDLKDLGFLLTFMGLDEFDWDFQKTFRIEVPYRCDHNPNNYSWSYDSSTETIQFESGDGWTANPVTKSGYDYETDEGVATRYIHKTDTAIRLNHDRPWVLELDRQGAKSLQFSPARSGTFGTPSLFFSGANYIWFFIYAQEQNPNGSSSLNGVKYTPKHYYMGVDISDKFVYNRSHTYTYTFENKIKSNGSNMIYVTIYDHDLNEVVFGPEPMDDLWVKEPNADRKLISTSSNMLSGKDIHFSYLGTTQVGIQAPVSKLSMRIWEGGKDYTPAEGTYTAPTCTTDGGIRHICTDCGYTYFTDTEPAKEHAYTDYTDDGNTTCTNDGTKTRKCTVCGETETVTVEGSALGHDFTDYTDDGNATCTDVGTKTRSCTVCGETETIPNEGSAAGHDFGTYLFDHNAACTEDGTKTATCKVCGDKDTVTAEGSATGHRYEAAVTAPTCTAEGYTTYTCHCGDSYVDDRTPVAPHTEVIDQAVASTCVQQGLTEGKHCSVCGLVTEPQMAAPLGSHKWDAGTVITAPTLTQPGTLMYTCEICGKTNHMSITELPSTGFEDVPADAYYAAAVAWAKENGITSGITETLFGSDMGCTRGQVVTFLWAAAGRPEAAASENPFTDVTEADYYYKPVLWAAEQGITGGIGEGLFGPDATCTRGQIVTFLWRAMNSPATGTTPDFTDVTASDWFAQPVAWAAENEVTGGIGNGLFGPNNTCTRAQVVTFLYKVYS